MYEGYSYFFGAFGADYYDRLSTMSLCYNYTLIITDNKATMGMEINFVIEKMNLRDSYLIKKREAQKNREADEFIMSIEMNINKINKELRGLTEANYG